MAHSSPDASHWLIDDGVTSYATAGCVTVVVGMARDEALTRIRADPSRSVAVGESRHDEGFTWVSVAGPEDGLPDSTIVLIEDNGRQGVRAEVLTQLSKRGKAASVC